MTKRLLDYSPRELAHLTRRELLDGIRAAEGRTVCTFVCPRAMNYVEKVTNIELAASFGSDMMNLEGLDPYKLQNVGLPSKDSAADQPYKQDLQADMGLGWTVREMKDMIGRPIGITLLVAEYEGQSFGDLYEAGYYSREMIRHIVDAGYDFVALCALNSVRNETMVTAVRETREIAGERIVIESGVQHGPGVILDNEWPPYDLKKIVTPEYLSAIATAGADIIDVPAVGVVPGFTVDYVSRLVEAIHAEKCIAACSVAHSIESADENTISNIVVNNKMSGVDMFNIAAGGVFESIALPDAIHAFCLAVKGKRHTYRRMCQSPLR